MYHKNSYLYIHAVTSSAVPLQTPKPFTYHTNYLHTMTALIATRPLMQKTEIRFVSHTPMPKPSHTQSHTISIPTWRHHPAEIKAVLESLSGRYYSNTKLARSIYIHQLQPISDMGWQSHRFTLLCRKILSYIRRHASFKSITAKYLPLVCVSLALQRQSKHSHPPLGDSHKEAAISFFLKTVHRCSHAFDMRFGLTLLYMRGSQSPFKMTIGVSLGSSANIVKSIFMR